MPTFRDASDSLNLLCPFFNSAATCNSARVLISSLRTARIGSPPEPLGIALTLIPSKLPIGSPPEPLGNCANAYSFEATASYLIRRLKNAPEILTSSKVDALKAAMQNYIGKDYDGLFAWSDKRMYCSEVLWKLYKNVLNIEAGTLQQLGDLDFTNPIVRRKLAEIYGGEIPMDETVISPQTMLECPLFETPVIP